MIRFVLRSECSYTQEKYKIEIFDSNFTGDPTYYTGAGSVFTLTHQQINPQEPYRQNIQQGQCTVSLHNDDSNFLSDLFDSQEGDMLIKIYKYPLSFASTHSENIYDDFIQTEDFSLLSDCDSGGVGELDAFTWIDDLTTGDSIYWQGYIFPDLCTYEESFDPYVLNLVAKDFLYTKREFYGSDLGFTFGTKSLFEVIYTILRDEFEIPFRSITSFAADDSGEDYLEQVYIDDSTLREYEQTGIGLIKKIEALQRILQSNNLMVKQTDGKWFITQMTAMDSNIVDVLEATNTSTAFLDTSVNIGQNPSNIITQSSVGVVNPVGIIQGRYLHRTRISTINVPGTVTIDQSTASKSYTSDITTDTDSHTISIVGQIAANTGATNTPLVKGYILIKYGTDYWDGDSWETYSSGFGVPIELDQSSPFSSLYTGTVSILTDFIPSGSEELSITLYRAEEFDSGGSFDEYALLTTYNLSVSVDDIDADKNNESQKIFASSGDFYTYEYDLADIYFGDAIVEYQKSKYTFSDGSNTSSWAYKGDTRNLSFIELITEDILGFLSKPKKYLRAIIRDDFEPYKVLQYDGSFWIYLGGTLNGKTGEWQVLLVESGKADPNATIGITDEFAPPGEIVQGIYGKTRYLRSDGSISNSATIESGGSSGTLSSQVQNLNNDGEFELTKLVKSTDTVFGATGKGLGLFQQSSQQNVSVSANFSITPTQDRIKVNSSTNDVEFQGITYTAGGGEKITVVFENAGTNNIIVKHGSTSVLDGYKLYFGEDIKVVSDYASMTFEFTNYTSVDEWQLVSYVEYGGITRDVEYTGSTINPVIELTALTNDADDYAIGDGTFFSVSMGAFYGGNDITGFAGGVDGREIEVINRGTDAIDVQHQNSGSLVTNRIISPTGADIILNQYDTVRLRYYEGTINRWVIVGGTY